MTSLQISRGFHRLGIFAALLSFTVCAIIGSTKYDPLGWWAGGILLGAASYALSRLFGWSVNGFRSTPDLAAASPAVGRAEAASGPAAPPPALQPEVRWPRQADGSPPKLGGWLVLPALSTLLAPFFALKGVYDLVPAFNALPELRSDLQAFVVISGLVNLGLVVSWAHACYLLVHRKQAFPSLFIALLIIGALVVCADQVATIHLLGTSLGSDGVRDLARATVGLVVWVPYMVRSKRVAATFVG